VEKRQANSLTLLNLISGRTLTERKLQADAEERRVMTQTYLALVKQGAAGEEDRLIILNALFRPTSDRSGADDSGSDIALPALLAKLMDQRMPK
jgi:hypothetical protein